MQKRGHPRPPSRQPDWLWIALAAVVIRLVYLLQWRHNPLFANPKVDELYHDQWAQAIAAGRDFVQGPYLRAPLYSFFLGGLYKAFGHSYLVPRVVQGLLDALTCVLVYDIGRRLYGRGVGIAAGLAAAGYWMLVFYTGELLDTTLVVFLDALFIWLLVTASRRPLAWRWLLAGVLAGLSADARPTALLLVPIFAGWILVLFRRTPRLALRRAGLLVLGCALAVAPVSIRNTVKGHDHVLIASNGGLNFYVGNNPASDGRTASAPGGALESWERDGGVTAAAQALGHRPTESEASGYFYDLAWTFIRTHPGQAFRLTFLKARLFWSRWEIANEQNAYFWTERFAPITRFLPLRFAVLGPLALLGLALSLRRGAALFPAWGMVLFTMVSTVPFFCPARYRMPMIPALVVLATAGVAEAGRIVKQRRWTAALASGAILLAASLWVNVTPHKEPGKRDLISWTMLGDAYDEAGELAAAVASYRSALAIAPGDLQATAGLGEVLGGLGQLPQGIDAFRLALEETRPRRAGDSPALIASIHSNLANALALTGGYAEAIDHYRAAIEMAPAAGQGSDQFNLGLVLERLGRPAEARAAFAAALEVNPGFTAARDALGRLAEAGGG